VNANKISVIAIFEEKESKIGKKDRKKAVKESRIVVIAHHVLSVLSHKIEAYVSKEPTKYISIAASRVPRRADFYFTPIVVVFAYFI
jgi:hypothetical protein